MIAPTVHRKGDAQFRISFFAKFVPTRPQGIRVEHTDAPQNAWPPSLEDERARERPVGDFWRAIERSNAHVE